MKTETKKLEGLINLALEKHAFIPVSAAELGVALNNLGEAIVMIPLHCYDAVTIKTGLYHASSLLAGLMYALDTRRLHNYSGNVKQLAICIETVHHKLSTVSKYCYNNACFQYQLLSRKKLLKSIAVIDKNLEQDVNAAGLYKLLKPCFNELHKSRIIPYHRWLWWLQFTSLMLNNYRTGTSSLENILSILNFNEPAYISWLIIKLQGDIDASPSVAGKLHFIAQEIIKYKNSDASVNGYFLANNSVRNTVLLWLKTELFCYKNIAVSATAVPKQGEVKINTSFSVPQLALFIRLLVDAKIINNTNQAALLKNVATIVYTSRAASLSPESLRVNYYTPALPAKSIVKDYLLQMMNLLKVY